MTLCPSCGAEPDIDVVFAEEQCPVCKTALDELHAIATEGGEA